MPAYDVLYRFTDQGRKDIKGTVRRAAEVRKMNEERGFKVLGHYWTQGRYDLVTVVDAPNEGAMTRRWSGSSLAVDARPGLAPSVRLPERRQLRPSAITALQAAEGSRFMSLSPSGAAQPSLPPPGLWHPGVLYPSDSLLRAGTDSAGSLEAATGTRGHSVASPKCRAQLSRA